MNNQIFEYYRELKTKLKEARELLEEHGYLVSVKISDIDDKTEEEMSKIDKKAILQEIRALESKLTGDIAKDTETTKEIYKLKRLYDKNE